MYTSRTHRAAEHPTTISPLAQSQQDTPEETAVIEPKIEEDKDEPLLFPDSDREEEDVRQTTPFKPVIDVAVKTDNEPSIDDQIALAEVENEKIKVAIFNLLLFPYEYRLMDKLCQNNIRLKKFARLKELQASIKFIEQCIVRRACDDVVLTRIPQDERVRLRREESQLSDTTRPVKRAKIIDLTLDSD